MWHNSKTNRIKGFTLIELLVSLGIMIFMLSVVLSNQSKYTGVASLNNTASDIYLSLRQAQAYGVGVREFTPGSVEFNVSYGVSFNTSASGSNDAYIFFADRGALNGEYDSGWDCAVGGSSECLSKTSILQGNVVQNICYVRDDDSEVCDLGGVDITFSRPDTKANFVFFNSSHNIVAVSGLKGAKIVLESPSAITRTVIVYTTGQVSIQ